MTDRFAVTRQTVAGTSLTLLLAVAGSACGSGGTEKTVPADSVRARATDEPAPEGAQVAPQTFRTLHWIEGRWRGNDSAQLVFYEDYRFLDDSTIAMRSFSDSMFSAPTDSSVVTLRGGRVENVSANATWVATTFNGNSVHFAPVKGARNRFIWERATTGWTARLLPLDGSGNAGQRLYHMTPMLR